MDAAVVFNIDMNTEFERKLRREQELNSAEVYDEAAQRELLVMQEQKYAERMQQANRRAAEVNRFESEHLVKADDFFSGKGGAQFGQYYPQSDRQDLWSDSALERNTNDISSLSGNNSLSLNDIMASAVIGNTLNGCSGDIATSYGLTQDPGLPCELDAEAKAWVKQVSRDLMNPKSGNKQSLIKSVLRKDLAIRQAVAAELEMLIAALENVLSQQ